MISSWFQKLNLMNVSHKVNIKLVASDHLLCWIILFVSEDIPAKLNSSKKRSIEGLYVEIHLRKQKWLITCSCNPNKCATYVNMLRKWVKALIYYKYFLLMEDFNIGLNNTIMKDCFNLYNLRKLTNTPTCYQNPSYPFCFDPLVNIFRSRML